MDLNDRDQHPGSVGWEPDLRRQQGATEALVALCERAPAVSSFSVGCSLGRGAGDALSDVDAAIGVRAGGDGDSDQERETLAVTQLVLAALPELGTVVDVHHQPPEGHERPIHRLFVQYDDRLQLDLAIVPEDEIRRGDAAPDFIALYDASPGAGRRGPSAWEVDADTLRSWSFTGWRALLDADKYVRRGSAWEAHQSLHVAREQMWRLWAAAGRAPYPWHGLSQVLDHDGQGLPRGIEDTVSGLDLPSLRLALLRGADVLETCVAAAARARDCTIPSTMQLYVRAVLSQG